jgi:hypothetical protein
MLIQFEKFNGRDPECDAEPYINGLAHITLSEVEIKTTRARAKKRSTQRKDPPSVRSRCRSESNQMSLNAHEMSGNRESGFDGLVQTRDTNFSKYFIATRQ